MLETAPEIAVLRAALAAAEARAAAAEGALVVAKGELTQVQAVVSAAEDMIRHLRLQIAKLRREQYGHSAERHARLIEQLEMQLEDLETDIAADRAMTEATAPKAAVTAFQRRRPSRKPFPDHLPRERVVVEAPASCTCCGSARIVKMGEDITETLEVIPRKWKVIQTVREKFTCRDCEKISQPPAPFHPTPRGWAGPNLLAMVLFARKYQKGFWPTIDFVAPLIAPGILFGRIGNFINGELWGRVTDLPWGMVFRQTGDNLPRHPSQLYEATLEGLALFLIVWLFSAKPRPTMAVSGVFALSYGIFRFLVEFVRQPDAQLGYLAFGWVTMGQVLSLPLIVVGVLLLTLAYGRTAGRT